MNIQYVEYADKYEKKLIHLFDNFQDYLINLDPLSRLRRQPRYSQNVLREDIKEVRKNGGIFLLAISKEKIVGFIIGILIVQSKQDLLGAYPARMGRITELYVEKEFQKQGIGKELMEKTENYLEKQGCEYVWIEVFLPNQNAHGFYTSLGYEDRDVEMIKKLSGFTPSPINAGQK